MSGTAVSKAGEFLGGGSSEVDSIRLSLNLLIDDMELLRAHVATATAVTATAASALLAYKVNVV
jgi:hypothetical protein